MMQAVKRALYQKAIGSAPLTTLLGGTRVYRRRPKIGLELPSITFLEVYDGRDTEIPRAEGLYQFDVWTATDEQADAIADALVSLFHRQPLTIVGRRLSEIVLAPPIRSIDEDGEGTDTIFRRVVQFTVISFPA